jgi:prophage tail gpP-like protein
MEYFLIKNIKSGKTFKINGFNSYSIDQTVDIPADFFNFNLSNKDAKISSKISAGDEVFFYVDDVLVLNGIIDDMDIIGDIASNSVDISGRDKSLMLLDNDASPTTYYNLNIEDYLKKITTQYGIDKFDIEDKDVFDKIVISAGQSEWGILDDLCKRKGLYPRYDVDTLRCTSLRADTDVDYYFDNHLDGSIKYKNYRIRISSDVKNEITVYSGSYKRGSDFSSSDTIKGTAKDDGLNIKKRRVMNEQDLENTIEATAVAKQELKLANRKAFTIEMETHTSKPIFINKVAKVTIKDIGLECYMLVAKVQYINNLSVGSITKIELRLMDGISINWDNHSIPTIPR